MLQVALLVALASNCCLSLPQEETDSTWSPLTVAHCRATCLRAFVPNSVKDSSCQQQPDCNMCWENCQLLQSDWSVWGAVCSEKTVCLSGCRAACRFFGGGGSGEYKERASSPPVTQTRAFEMLSVEDRRASWPCKPGRVYVVMWRPAASDKWAQVTQTVSCSADLPPGAGSARVLSVTPGGLLTVYTPAPSRLQAVAVISNSVHQDNEDGGDIQANGEAGGEWSVRVSSLLHQGVLVIAELSWRPPAPDLESVRKGGGTALYLVTWEVDGGGITGNLFTDNTCVTLSLWPDTAFHIRVELVSRSVTVSRSRPLLVNTSSSPPPAEKTRGRPAPATVAPALLLAAGLVLLVVTGTLVVVFRKRRHSSRDDRWSLMGHEETAGHGSKDSLYISCEETRGQYEVPAVIKGQHQKFPP